MIPSRPFSRIALPLSLATPSRTAGGAHPAARKLGQKAVYMIAVISQAPCTTERIRDLIAARNREWQSSGQSSGHQVIEIT